MKINTVNVVENIIDSDSIYLTSFSNDKEGKEEADKLLYDLALENGASEENKESILADGYYIGGNCTIEIVYSN